MTTLVHRVGDFMEGVGISRADDGTVRVAIVSPLETIAAIGLTHEQTNELILALELAMVDA